MQKRQMYKLQDNGIMVDNPRVYVSIAKLKDVKYDSKQHYYYKIYETEPEYYPLTFTMRRRDPNHYLNMNTRCNQYIQSFKPERQVVCLNMQLFGVMGRVQNVDVARGNVKVEFDKEEEEAKIHDAFFGQRVLADQQLLQQQGKRYYSDVQIEQLLGLQKGFVNKLTGSYLLAYTDREKFEKQVVDLGLNIKNYAKKVHIPDYVRFVSDPDSVADHQYDEYSHNQHARGTRHVRKHFEYSQECFDTIAQYKELFKDVLEAMQKGLRINKAMLNIKDLFGKQVDEFNAVNRIKKLLAWIEESPLSHMPFVEMGFDALNESLIQTLDATHSEMQSDKYQSIKLKCKNNEYLQPSFLYQENFPYWSPPFSDKTVTDYRVGDRVLSINSSKREYVPFGLRGTVVGHTNDKVIILFDQQYLGGHNIHGHCQDLKGGNIDPNYLINLTQKFTQILKKNAALVMNFQEKNLQVGETPATPIVPVQQPKVKQEKHAHQPRYNPKPQTLTGDEKKPQYVAKQKHSGLEQKEEQKGGAGVDQTQAHHIDDDKEEEFQDLGQLQKQSSTFEQLKVDAPVFVPTFTPAEVPIVDQVPEDDDEEEDYQPVIESGFVPSAGGFQFDLPTQLPQSEGGAPLFQLNLDPNLIGNNDFNQLLTLMNQLNTQLQAPSGGEPNQEQQQQDPSNPSQDN
ncbi:hypothetical protein FGO68_gene15840 [Halteria grandinella]|uniref:Uncharacterized protein n=1 Tax=Halteria grandinella TaxID=5974 RepID=A0A8J8SWW5_HALGN|nr:hypothetical protein FGO68_gene15840 [Halteria grandinella]